MASYIYVFVKFFFFFNIIRVKFLMNVEVVQTV